MIAEHSIHSTALPSIPPIPASGEAGIRRSSCSGRRTRTPNDWTRTRCVANYTIPERRHQDRVPATIRVGHRFSPPPAPVPGSDTLVATRPPRGSSGHQSGGQGVVEQPECCPPRPARPGRHHSPPPSGGEAIGQIVVDPAEGDDPADGHRHPFTQYPLERGRAVRRKHLGLQSHLLGHQL